MARARSNAGQPSMTPYPRDLYTMTFELFPNITFDGLELATNWFRARREIDEPVIDEKRRKRAVILTDPAPSARVPFCVPLVTLGPTMTCCQLFSGAEKLTDLVGISGC